MPKNRTGNSVKFYGFSEYIINSIFLLTKKKILQKSKLYCIYNKSDGATVMKRVGRLLKVNHQLCLAHGIQLSVIKTLYKRSISENQVVAVTEFEHVKRKRKK